MKTPWRGDPPGSVPLGAALDCVAQNSSPSCLREVEGKEGWGRHGPVPQRDDPELFPSRFENECLFRSII